MKRNMAAFAGCAAACAAVGLVAASGGGAQSPTGQTFTVIERSRDSDAAFIDNKPLSPRPDRHGPRISRGDLLAFSSRLLTPAGAKLGHADGSCVATRPGRFDKGAAFACSGAFHMPDGALTVQAVSVSTKVTRLVVTGGTGAFVGARGTIVSTSNSDTKSTDIVTLLG